jgi:hypothetical protein
MAKKKKKKKGKDVLCVAAKVKEFIKSKKMMASGDLVPALSDEVYVLLEKAIARCKANKRSIVSPKDL